MLELGDRADLAEEHVDGALGLQQVRGEDFQRHDPPHRAMLGLVDAPHAAPSDLFEDLVLAQDEPGRLALEDALGLEAREDLLLDEEAGQRPAARDVGVFPLDEGELLVAQQAALTQVRQEGLPIDAGGDGHDDAFERETRGKIASPIPTRQTRKSSMSGIEGAGALFQSMDSVLRNVKAPAWGRGPGGLPKILADLP